MDPPRATDLTQRMRPRSASALIATLLGAGALALVTSGCGASGPVAALDPVAQAAETTTHAEGAQLTVKVTLAGGEAGQLALSGHGDLNLRTDEGEIVMDMSGLPAAARSVLPAGGLQMTELLAGRSIYVGSPLLAGRLPGGARWLKIDLDKVAQDLGVEAQSLGSGQTNPGQYLQYLRASGGSVRAAGRATIRGVPTIRYTGAIDLRRAAELLPSRDRAATESAMAKLIAATGTSSYPVQAWIDTSHMIRRLEIDFPVDAQGHRLTGSVVEELFDFGPIPAVSPPAAGEVFEANLGSLPG